MAVIREQRQFGLSPVRVVRAETGGQAVGQALAQAGETFSDIMFRRASVQAEKTGREAALSVESQNVVAFDPVTQKPVALTPPKGFGTIATEAYQNVINQRFNQEIESDIKNRGTELALQFKDSANGSELYNQAMQDYVDQLKENAGGMYGEYISNVGGEYRESTYLKLKQDEQDRARAEAKRVRQLQHADNVSNALSLYSQIGPEADAQMPASTAADMARSGQGSYTESALENKQLRQARAAGIALFSINRTGDEDPNSAQNDLQALAMGPIGLTHIKDPMLKKTMAEFANDKTAWSQVAGEIYREAETSIQRNILEDTVAAYNSEAIRSFSAEETSSRITTGDITSIGSEVDSLIEERRFVANSYIQERKLGRSEEVARSLSGLNDYNSKVNVVADALTNNLIRSADSVAEIQAASLALQRGSADGLTGDLYDTVSQIVSLSKGLGDKGIIDTAVSDLGGISAPIAFAERQAEEQANAELINLNDELATKLAMANQEDLESIRAEFDTAASAENVTNGQQQRQLFENHLARAHIRFAVDEAVTSSQLSAIEDYLRFGTDDNYLLSDSIKSNLNAANNYGAKDPSRLNESLSTYLGGKAEGFRLEAQRAETQRLVNSIIDGSANPNDKDTRVAVETGFGAQLTPENLPVFKNVLSETLYNQFSKFGDGTLSAAVELDLLNQWDLLSNTLAPDGTALKTNAYLSISAEQRAKLDEGLAVVRIYGENLSEELLAATIREVNNSLAAMSSKENIDRAKQDLGDKTIEQFVLSEFPMAAYSRDVKEYVQTRLTVALSQIYSTPNRTLGEGARSNIVKEIKDGLNSVYTPDFYVIGEGVPFGVEPLGMAARERRPIIEAFSPTMGNKEYKLTIDEFGEGRSDLPSYTMYPLERTTGGHTKDFVNYASAYTQTKDIKFRPVASENGGTLYLVYKRVGSQYVPVTRELTDEGDGGSVSVPLMLSTNDTMFRNGIARRASRISDIEEAKEIAEAQEIMASQDKAIAISELVKPLESQLASVSGIQAGTVRKFFSGDVGAMNRIYNTLSGYTGDRRTPEVIEILSAIENIRSQIGNQ